MFAAMALSTAKAGHEGELAKAALDHARALRAQPGCLGAWVLRERGTRAQVALSIFESEGSFESGTRATAAVIAAHHPEQLVEGDFEFRVFDVD